MIGGLAIYGLHQQEFQIIRRSQILGHSALCYRVFPEHGAPLPSQRIPILLVIIDDGLNETALQFFQRHPSRLCRPRGVMDAVAGIGQASGVSLGHPAKDGFHRALR